MGARDGDVDGVVGGTRGWKKGQAANHEDNRTKVCGPCGRKITLKEVRQRISEKNISRIRKFLNPSFDPTDPEFPTGVCNTFITYLTRADNTGKTEKLPKMLKYADIILPKTTRAIDGSRDCNCNMSNI